MSGSALFFCVGLLALLGVFVPKQTRQEEAFWRARRNKTVLLWRGEPRPKGARRVELSSRWLSESEMCRLVNECGYPVDALTSGIYFQGRDKDTGEDVYNGLDGLSVDPELTYLRETTHGGGFHAKTVSRAITQYLPKVSENHAKAVFEVMVLRRRGVRVAKSLGLKASTVYQNTWVVMQALREEGSVML